jgi:hypothetical protein
VQLISVVLRLQTTVSPASKITDSIYRTIATTAGGIIPLDAKPGPLFPRKSSGITNGPKVGIKADSVSYRHGGSG